MTPEYVLADCIEPVWLIDCSRCQADGVSFFRVGSRAADDLESRGWQMVQGARVLCPQCRSESR